MGCLIDNSKKDIVFDFKDISFIDSSGIGLVLGRYNQLKNNHRTLILSGLSDSCFRLFELTGLFLIMPYFDSLEDIREGVYGSSIHPKGWMNRSGGGVSKSGAYRRKIMK